MNRIHQILDDKPVNQLAVTDFDGTPYSYGQMRDLAIKVAAMLASHGVRAGDRVILVSENAALYAAVLFATSRLSAWIILVNARQSAPEIDAIVAHSGARCIVFTTVVSEQARAHANRMGAREIGTTACGPVVVTDVAHTKPEPVDPTGQQVATLLYTTGTTSAPKGVMLTHRNLLFNAATTGKFAGLARTDRVLCVLPGSHIYCLASAFLPAIMAGGAVRFVPRFHVAEVIDMLDNNITRFPGVPQMFAAIMEHLDKTGTALRAPNLGFIAAGGAPLDPDLKLRVERVFGLPLNNGYGLTETSPSVAATHNDHPRTDISVGHPYAGIDLFIDAPDNDGIGELWIRGENVMKGYYRDPERTAEVLTDDGYFKSGDLARRDPDGALYIVGRTKELIIRSGFNVHPPEVEAMLTRHPNVLEASVVGRQVASNEEILAFVKTDSKITGANLRIWLKDRLVGYKIPQHILIVDHYPAAATGKILKHKLISHFADLLIQRDQRAG